jgi:hypothetical protein
MNKNIILDPQKYYLVEDIQVIRQNNVLVGENHPISLNAFKNEIYKLKVLNLPPDTNYKLVVESDDNRKIVIRCLKTEYLNLITKQMRYLI